jgi:hypothetical protein
MSGKVLHLHPLNDSMPAKLSSTNSITAGIGFLIDQDETLIICPQPGCRGGRCRDHAHQVAVIEEPGAGGDQARIGCQSAGDLHPVAGQPAGLHLQLAHAVVCVDAIDIAEAVSHHDRGLRHGERGRGTQVELAAREHAGARAAGSRARQRGEIDIDQPRARLRIDRRADHADFAGQTRATGRGDLSCGAGGDAAQFGGCHFGAPFQAALPDQAEQLRAAAHHRAHRGRARGNDAAVRRHHLRLRQPHLLRLRSCARAASTRAARSSRR